MQTWLIGSWQEVGMVVLSVIAMYVVVMLCIRFVGLRSLAKMSPTDFVWTVATGSLLASSISMPNPSIVVATVAFASVFLLRFLSSLLRKKVDWFANVTQNEPLLLMEGEQILDANLHAAEVTRDDLFAKLRESNVYDLSQVLAVVMETTGDISVLHSSDSEASLEESLLRDVRRSA